MKPTHIPLLGLCLLSTFLSKAQAFFPSGADNYADAPLITTQSDVSNATNLFVATKEPGEPGHHPGLYDGAAKTVWWKWTAPETGFCTVETITPSYINSAVQDTVLSVYTGTAFPLTRIASNDNASTDHFAPNAYQSRAIFYATAGVTYSIAVDGAFEGIIASNAQITTLRLRQIPAKAVTRRAVWRMRRDLSGSGMLSMTTTTTGSYSAVFQVGAVKYAFTGVFDRDGWTVRSVIPVAAKGAPPPSPITLRMDGAGLGQYSIETDAFTTGNLFPRQKIYTSTVLNPLIGSYNLGGEFATQGYHERGWAQATVSASGVVAIVGTGPDGSKFTTGTFIHESGNNTDFILPAYSALHGNKGFIHWPGSATLLTNTSNDPELSVECDYAGPPIPAFSGYGGSYVGNFILKGKRYVKPVLNARVQGFLNNSGSGILRIREDYNEMDNPISEALTLTTANKFIFATPLPRKVSLSVNTANGLVTGSITTTDTIAGVTKARVRKLQGIIFREGPNVWLRGHATGFTKNLYMEVVYSF